METSDKVEENRGRPTGQSGEIPEAVPAQAIGNETGKATGGGRRWKGVFKFNSHEEADAWMEEWMKEMKAGMSAKKS